MKDTMPWHISPLVELAKVERGKFSHRPRNDPSFYGGETPFIQTGDVSNAKQGVIRSYHQTLNARGLRVSKTFPKGTLMVSIAANIGDAASLGFDSACPDSVIAITTGARLNSSYLRFYLRSQQRWIQYLAPAGAQKNINIEFLEDVEIEYPPLPEQRKIADILTTWDEALEKLDDLIELKMNCKKALMQQLLTGRKRLNGFTNKWKTVTLGDVIESTPRPTGKPKTSFLSAGVRCHGKGVFLKHDFVPGDIALDELFELKAGDLIVNITFAWEGAAAIVPHDADGALVSHRFPTFIFRDGKAASSFFRHYILTHRFVFACGLASPGGAGRNRVLSKSAFLKIELPLPCVEEQRSIGAILDTADQELSLLCAQRAALEQQKRGLMQRLLTGKLRVTPNSQ